MLLERYCWLSELQSGSLVRRWVGVYPFRAVFGGDVAESAFVFAGHSGGWLVSREPADQGSEVHFELRVQTAQWYVLPPPLTSGRIATIRLALAYSSTAYGALCPKQVSREGVAWDVSSYGRGALPT